MNKKHYSSSEEEEDSFDAFENGLNNRLQKNKVVILESRIERKLREESPFDNNPNKTERKY